MTKLKFVEIVVMAGAALMSVAKYALKFFDCIFKLSNKNAAASSA